MQVFARLKPGYTVESAAAPLQGLFTQIRTYESTLPAAKDWSAFSRDRFMKGQLLVTPAAMGYSPLRNDFSTPLVVLMCMVGLVLLIACANVANLLIARGFMRQKEIAVRLSLGASRGRLVKQLLVESLVLSIAGGVVGLILSFVLTRGLLALIPSDGQPLLIRPEPDLRILAFTLGLTCLTGIVFGLLPALRASRPDPWTTLKDTVGSIAGTGGSLFLRKGLVTAQVALSFLLLFGAGLFVRSLQNLQGTETGVALDNLITFQLSPALNGYDTPRAVQFYQNLLERLNSAPGVTSAGIAAVPILSGSEWDSSMSVEGHRPADGEDMQAFMNALSPGYFKTMKIPFLEGRDFQRMDFKENSNVAIVNRKFAEHFFKGTSAVGKRLGQGVGPNTKLTIEIIGVVADSLYEGPREGVRRQVFVPHFGASSAAIYVRTTMPSSAAYSLVRGEVRQQDATMPVYDLKTLEAQLDETLLTDRLIALLSAGFGLLATVLASVGLYGVMAFVVARRKKELGIRLALGAQPGLVIWLVMREVLVLLAIGLAIGIPAAMLLGRYVSSQLYGIQAHDPLIASSTTILADARVGRGRVHSRSSGQPDRSNTRPSARIETAEPCRGLRIDALMWQNREASVCRIERSVRMAKYVDGFVLPVPKKNLEAYRRMSVKAGKIWREYGALEYRECFGDDLNIKYGVTFPRRLKVKPGETVAFSWIVYKSRAHRDRVNKKVMNDPRLASMMDPKSMPFDGKRMSMGGFKSLVWL